MSCKFPEEVRKYAAEVLNESEESREKGLERIKKWAGENRELHVRTEDEYIIPFLRSCKFNLEKTEGKIRNFYVMRGERSEWFQGRDPSDPAIRGLMEMGSTTVLRKLHQNQLVAIIKAGVHDPKIHSLDTVIKTALMIMDVALFEEELSQIYGAICIIDLKNVGLGHARQLSISRIKHLTHTWQNYYCRPQRFEFINAPGYMGVMLNIFKSFLPAKMASRIHVCFDGISSLKDIVDETILPQEYGGEGESIKDLSDYWVNKLTSMSAWFAQDETFRADVEAQ